jgi:hypothetical protein
MAATLDGIVEGTGAVFEPLTAEKKFWRCVESGETPLLFGVEPPRPWVEAIRIVDKRRIRRK